MAKFTFYMKNGDIAVVRAMNLPTIPYLKDIGIPWDNVQFFTEDDRDVFKWSELGNRWIKQPKEKMSDDDFLLAVKDYIESMEVRIESEWGSGETLSELIEQGCMPDLYKEVLRRVKKETLPVNFSRSYENCLLMSTEEYDKLMHEIKYLKFNQAFWVSFINEMANSPYLSGYDGLATYCMMSL